MSMVTPGEKNLPLFLPQIDPQKRIGYNKEAVLYLNGDKRNLHCPAAIGDIDNINIHTGLICAQKMENSRKGCICKGLVV